MVYQTSYPWYIEPPGHGIYWTPYAWYIEPPTHGSLPPTHDIANSLPMEHTTPCYGVMNPLLLEEMKGSI